MIQVIHEKPPIYDKLKDKFDIDWERGIIITYGQDIYCKYDLHPAKIVHELTHVKQQEGVGAERWYLNYINDKEFRLKQELEAYKNEIDFYKDTIKDRNQRFNLIRSVYLDISSGIYGNMITYEEAKQKLQ